MLTLFKWLVILRKIKNAQTYCHWHVQRFQSGISGVFKSLFTWSGGPRSNGVSFFLFSRSGGQKTKETYPIRPGSPTPCKQGVRHRKQPRERHSGSTPLYKPYRYVPPQKVWFWGPFGLKKGYTLCPFFSGIGYGFRGNYGSVWT